MKKKILCLILIGVMLLSLAACGGDKTDAGSSNQPAETGSEEKQAADSAPEYTLQLGCAYTLNEDTPRAISTKMIKEKIEARSNGKIKVELYPDNQLGGDRELLESCQAGNVALVSQTTAPQVAFIPNLAIFDLPHLFDDLDNAYKVLSGPIKNEIAKEYEKAGFKLLLMAPIDFRVMSSNKPIKTMADFKGIKIRTMENPYHMDYWKALGANPTPLNFAELYIALQQGIVDAQENPHDILLANKFYEVQKYIVKTNHIAFISTVIMNKQLYDSMPADYQKIIDESMEEVSVELSNLSNQMVSEMLAKLQERGMEVIELSPELKEQILEASQMVYDNVRKGIGDEPVDKLLKAIEDAK